VTDRRTTRTVTIAGPDKPLAEELKTPSVSTAIGSKRYIGVACCVDQPIAYTNRFRDADICIVLAVCMSPSSCRLQFHSA